jgi:hypothetical protein
MADTKIFGITVNTDAITNLPDTYKIAAGAVVAGLILFGAGYYVNYPVYQEYQVLLDDNEKLTQDNQAMETKLGFTPPNRYRAIENIETEMASLDSEIKTMQTRIPDKENIPTLIYDLEKIVEENNKSDLLDIVPSQLSSVTLPANLQSGAPTGLNLQQVALNLNIESSYPSMINLFKDFERYQRAVATTSLFLSPITDPTDKFSALKVTLNLKAYVLPEGVVK